METEKLFEQIVSGEELTFDQKMGVIKNLVSWKIYNAIQENTVLSSASWEPVSFQVVVGNWSAEEKDVERLLNLIWAKNISVSSEKWSWKDMWWHTEYWVVSKISFSM